MALLTLGAAQASAQVDTAVEADVRQFHVPAGPLATALVRFGAQAGIQFNVDSRLTNGKMTNGIDGRFTTEDALQQLLADSGLRYSFMGARTIVIEEAVDVGDAQLTDALRVGGSTGGGGGSNGGAVNGVNGSRDITATEGTGSYTTGAASIATKTAQSLKDTPQSVSVVTRQRLDEQKINDFSQLMAQTTGVSTITGTDGPLNPQFYSRGLRIQRMQIDGGAPIDISSTSWGLNPQIDLGLYDHVEIMRGADGLFNGYGDPGGVVSLTRKRPLDHQQALVEVQAGSWNNIRTSADLTGALTADKSLRTRVIAVWQKRGFFYDYAKDEKVVLSGMLEYDVTPSTLVMVGANHTEQDGVPFTNGLPFYQDGTDLNLPRNTCLCFNDNSYTNNTDEFYSRIEQGIGANWNLTVNGSHIRQKFKTMLGNVTNSVNPITDAGPTLLFTRADKASTQTTVDATLAGSFALFGKEQKLVIGANFSDANGGGAKAYTSAQTAVPVDVLNFNRNDPRYVVTAPFYLSADYVEARMRQFGAYGTLQLNLWDPLHISIGMRYSWRKRADLTNFYCAAAAGCTATGGAVPLGGLRSSSTADYTSKDLSWPPNMSASFDITRSLSVYASYAEIFQDQSTSLDLSGKPLDPIRGNNVEGGIKWAARGGKLNASLSAYRIRQRNFALYVGRPTGYVAAPGTVCCYTTNSDNLRRSQGIDAEVTGELLPGWQMAASYTWNQNKYVGVDTYADGIPLQTRFPEHLYKIWTEYSFRGNDNEWLHRLSIGGGINGQSRGYYTGRACPSFNQSTGACLASTVPFNIVQGAFILFSGRLAYKLNNTFELSANLNNIANKKYYQTVSTPNSGNWYGEGRTFLIALSGRL